MVDIILCTLNARYIHSAFGLRYLLANLGELEERAKIVEFDIHQRPADVAEKLLLDRPRIIGLGVYIWNVVPMTELVSILKKISPETIVVIGGPEVSYESEEQEIVKLADYLITGEADLAFYELCKKLLENQSAEKITAAALPQLANVKMPYRFYSDEDIAHRVLYVEASRGCPFTCEFCLSSLDIPVRTFPLDVFLAEMQSLIDRGAKHFKFVDRTFNLNIMVSRAILQFFRERWQLGMFYHFELIPDRLPASLREIIADFPAGSLQFEVGIQTFDETTSKHISRRQNYAKLEDNLTYLSQHTGVHVHADMIAGLPSESLESFGKGFDRLLAMGSQEIQVGILKRLRGTPICRHDDEHEMIYSNTSPYELLSNKMLDFPMMQKVKRFARYWDLLGNSGRFTHTLPLLLKHEKYGSPFWNLWHFSESLFASCGKQHGIAPEALAAELFSILMQWQTDESTLQEAILADHHAAGNRHTPAFLQPTQSHNAKQKNTAAKRQQRHLQN